MLEGILKDLPVNVAKLGDSPEFKRILESLYNNLKGELRNPDSSFGLALNAAFAQLSNKDSIVMNEADFSFMERQLLSTVVQATYDKLKG